MKSIQANEDFDALLKVEQAILFTFFDWSSQADLSLNVFTEWEHEWKAAHPNAPVGFYRLDPDHHPYTWQWLAQHARGEDGMDGGFGAVTWLRNGNSVAFVRYAAKAGKQTLSRLTDGYFGTVTFAEPGAPGNAGGRSSCRLEPQVRRA